MSKTAKDVVKMGQEVKMVDFRFTDLPGSGSTLPFQRIGSPKTCSRVASGSTARPSAAFRRFTSPICS